MATSELDDRLGLARVLVEIGELYDAEAHIAGVLEERPDDLCALDLLAKLKHMRGELTGALALWAQVHERSPRSQAGLIRLASVLQLARDTARGGGEFLALGHFQLWKKPAAHLELEEVFRLFLARRPDQAIERCDQLVRKYQGKDADLYKLAVLAKAWVSELSGDLEAARSILEELGRERGFETDSDRILALARLYEQTGTKELLEKAVHIYEFFARSFEKVSVLGHLASLHRKLDHGDEASRYEERFVALFRRRMHRPTRAEATHAAARFYVPLHKLEPVLPRREAGPIEGLSGRERAVDLALQGERAPARELFAAGGKLLDLKYQADLAAMSDSRDGAVHGYIACLRREPEDIRIVGWLLDEYRRTQPEAIASYFREAGKAEGVDARLTAAIRLAPVRASLWRQREALHRISGRADEATRCAERAAVLEQEAERRKAPVGRVLAAAVYHFVGKARGLIHEVWATRRPADPGRGGFLEEILGNLTPELSQSVRNTFLSAREYARAKWPQRTGDILDYTYSYKVTKDDEPSGGTSAGLPTALAFLSVFLDRPVPQNVAFTGVLVADSHDVLVIKPVGEPEYKVRGACNRNLARVILPEGNRRELAGSPLVPSAICDEIVSFVSDLDQAVILTWGDEVFME